MNSVVAPPMTVLIVDDEPIAREGLRLLLQADSEVQVVGDATGIDALELITRLRPDILFLDIQMPELDGFELLQRVGADAMPVVVFATAFDRYALRAFEVHALDYLLKPFSDARFAAALERAKAQVQKHRQGTLDARIEELLRMRQLPSPSTRTRFLIPARDKTIVVEASQIDRISAEDYYVCLHCGVSTHLLRESMDAMERQLDPEQFIRVHRASIVNLERVREIHPLFRGDCELKLSDGSTVRLSRSRRSEFEARFAQLGLRR